MSLDTSLNESSRCLKKVPLHIPHKKILEKYDMEVEIAEPLTGFGDSQNRRIRRQSMIGKKLTSIEPFASKTKPKRVQAKKQLEVLTQENISQESFTLNELRRKPQIEDLHLVVEKMKTTKKFFFIYLMYAVPTESIYFTPYCLAIVPYKKINLSNYITMSPYGVVHYTKEQIFTKLSVWEHEYKIFCALREIKFFNLFRMWKAFYLWRKTLIYKKYTSSRKKIQKLLFTLNFVFGRCLLKFQERAWIMYHESFAELTLHKDVPLYYFIENQMERLEHVQRHLKDFNVIVLKSLRKTCHWALKQEGFNVENEFDQLTMNYTEKAKKRNFCLRITCFIKLVDLMTIHMLHSLMKRSYSQMAHMFYFHYSATPSPIKLLGTETETILEIVPRETELGTWPLFQVELDISDNYIPVLDPSENVICGIFEKIKNLWDMNINHMKRFQLEEYFFCFYKQAGVDDINVKNILELQNFILTQDESMLADEEFLMSFLPSAYETISLYLRRFKTIWNMYKEDVEMDINILKENRELSVLKTLCIRYRDEIKHNEQISTFQTLGAIFLCLKPMKDKLIAQPLHLFNILAVETPGLGREMVRHIIESCDKVNEDLNREPETSSEIIEYNQMLNGIEEVVLSLEEKLEYVRELYDMMGEYSMVIPPDDMQEYLGLGQILGNLRLNCERVLEAKERLTKKFNSQINTDIDLVLSQLYVIKSSLAEPWLIDINSDPVFVVDTLNQLQEKLQSNIDTYKQIQDWQRVFKMHVTRIDLVGELSNELQLRQILWKSHLEWGGTRDIWYHANFEELDLEEVQTTTGNYGKIVNKIEKSLPSNKIVPRLKDSVEEMKSKLGLITYLKNPALKPRHWLQIEAVLNTRFTIDTVITLDLLENLGVFKHIEEITEISGLASSEEALEVQLQKIEDIWKILELPVLPYRDSKDIFMLGSLEDVQAGIDESIMLIGIILSSRNCTTIKSRVEDWERMMIRFSKTLNEWFLCMQTWMYLEVLFSAPDIQRQLPNEARLFTMVDKSWKDIMRRTAKVPLALAAANDPLLLDTFIKNNAMLDQIMKCLEAYLETKRVAFPRFFFLSNDELLEILAQTRNPHAVQPHLRKCFDAIAKLEFAAKPKDRRESDEIIPDNAPVISQEMEITTDIAAMISPENERVVLGKGLKARGNVEDWLGKVEESMFASLRKLMKSSLTDYMTRPRTDWMTRHANQIVLTVSQIMWAKRVHQILESKLSKIDSKLAEFEKENILDLNDSAALTRQNISKLFRKVLCALITIDVHARDTITNMLEKEVRRPDAFDWLKMIRYYWDQDIDNCVARMSSAYYVYGHEYIGAGGVLVITPLTDRCYLCLMGALQLDLGGAPAGPAGTGKTETTKDLAKALAIQCVVFNCSEGLDYKMMGRFFSGLVSSGAWCCFDEFNRINIEVLSVIAQQLITIRNAKVAKQKRFVFEGREIKLIVTCAVFITMNPGYAGRTELPDNLKALFRPISMMVPDYGLIAEVILYSEGFESSRNLAKKMVQMYKLCSEQLSQQDHYDFGMRAVKSVLVMAGALKRASPDQHEEVTLMCALRDSNLPKFLADDAILFAGILGDLFPGISLPEKDYAVMEEVIKKMLLQNKLQIEQCQIAKVIQLHETMIVRWGVMLVGPTGGGKTVILTNLGETLTELKIMGIEDQYFQIVHKYVMNPKALSMGELYGEVNALTLEWKDGLLAIALRTGVQCTKEDHQWIICDGPVDAVWIENMNTVLDDNKMLCLANSERIKLTPYVHMVFEVENLAQASPATVSRCGMVYVDPSELQWQPYVRTWLEDLPENLVINAENKSKIYKIFHLIDAGFYFIRKSCFSGINQVDISKVSMLCSILESLLLEHVDKFEDKDELHNYIVQCFMFAYVWAIGGNLLDDSRVQFEIFLKKQFEEILIDVPLPVNLWDVYIDHKTKCFDDWNKIVPNFTYNSSEPFFETLVPTKDTVRYGYIMEKLIKRNRPVMFTGNTGVGKSVIAKTVLKKLGSSGLYVPFTMNFSAQTSSMRTQEIFESHLERRKKTILGAPWGKKVLIFIDDVNMPKLDVYGSQATIELLRQYLDFGGLYDREKMFWKEIRDVVLNTACAPPGGGRNPLTPRFTRHFAMLFITTPTDDTLKVIFKSILNGYLEDFVLEVSGMGTSVVNAAVDIYGKVMSKLLPTPTKSHYVFNLRDLSKCMQGVLQADAGLVKEPISILKLFYHECLRVFHDRLINAEDRSYFFHLMYEVCMQHFGQPILEFELASIVKPPLLLFGDFLNYGAAKENRVYEEIKNLDHLKDILYFYLEEYNSTARAEMKLVLFTDAAEHVVRIARVLRAERGHALLVGPGGSGRRSLATLAAFINEYKCFGMELTKNYDMNSFHDDLRSLYMNTGIKNEDTVFLFTDTQILQEEFLEDINNILNSGEVPNLFESEDYEKVILACRQPALEAGVNVSDREAVFTFFINKIRAKLHLCICMSPVGDVFRRRCRMFPSLVNCCTIDWFVKWPTDALFTVATNVLSMQGAENVPQLAEICVLMHESTEVMTDRLYAELHRYFYTTPSSYLDLLKLYCNMLDKKRQEILKSRARIANGLSKLYETYDVVGVMEQQVKEMAPIIAQKAVEVKKMMANLKLEETAADLVKKGVLEDEAKAKIQAAATQELADDAGRDLALAMPAMKAAQDALKSLNKADINELRVFNKPPALVKFVMEPVCLLLGAKTDWDSAKKVLGESNFLKMLEDYDKDHIKDVMLKKIKMYIDHKDFDPETVVKVSKVCRSMVLWVKAVDTYAKVFRVVEPKILKQKEAEEQMAAVMAILKEKQDQLAQVEAMLAAMQASLQKMLAESAALQGELDLAEARLNRAGKLTQALTDEQIRWEETVKNLTLELECTTGNIIVGSGCVAYFGAFPTNYRQELLKMWIDKCLELQIPISHNFSMTSVLSDAYTVRFWNTNGLPRDSVSVENGILVTKAGRWPLMIDPQEQANRWIRNMERDNQLQIVRLTEPTYMRVMETSIRLGRPVLIEDIAETLDPTLSPILQKNFYIQGGRLLIHLGDADIEYDSNFKLYITTKLANPHYLPDICIQVTIVNFTVTLLGLEDQLLADVVRVERPDLEEQRSELIMRINNDKMQLLAIEDKILRMLFASSGNILDDEELIETLNKSKETSSIVVARLLDSETTEKSISIAREKYRPLATRGAVLYFAVSTLSTIDPMYQFSLKYFQLVFNNVLENAEKSNNFDQHVSHLLKAITLAVYVNISRGLFEKHKLVYSFLLNMAVYQQANLIPESYWVFFLRGPIGSKVVSIKKPYAPGLSDAMWFAAQHLDETYRAFRGLKENCLRIIKVTIGSYVQEIKIIRDTKLESSVNFDAHLSDFEKLILLKALKSEALIGAITEYVCKNLGRDFIESTAVSLNSLYKDMTNVTPLCFILSSGSDPFGAFHKFATEMGYRDRIHSISLGQGQGPIAEKIISHATSKGDWVFLQNCHLAASWMLSLEQIVQNLSSTLSLPNDAFRLFLSSMPTNDFPVSVLQNSVKVTNEAPKGLRANIKRAFIEMSEDMFEGHPLQQSWRNMIFGLCMFHAVIQERKKFGSLGWTIVYEFSDSDRECALSNLEIFCRNSIILWDALQYITGEITYGGRVTDIWDQRCLKTILCNFFAPHVLNVDYKYSPSGVYYCPQFEKLEDFKQFIEELPIIEEPEIFGMHENANIAFQMVEINQFIDNILKGQALGSGDKGGVSPDQIVWKLSEDIKQDIVKLIDVEKMLEKHMEKDSLGRVYSLTTVLIQEINRFNKLLKFMHSSLSDLQKAIKGFIVMSDDLEDVFRSFMNNQVPKIWTAKAYNSLKSLGSWVHDLILRIDFIDHWMQFGFPPSSWISGLFFPQGLLTGTLQAYSRRYGVSINQLLFDFTPMPFYISQDEVKNAYASKNKDAENQVFHNLTIPENGIYIHGLFIDAGRWDIPNMQLADSNPGERCSPLPVFWLRPVTTLPSPDLRYVAPLYKTAARAGVLSTTGHSTNFVIPFLLVASQPQPYWILRGTALITQNTE